MKTKTIEQRVAVLEEALPGLRGHDETYFKQIADNIDRIKKIEDKLDLLLRVLDIEVNVPKGYIHSKIK